MALYPTTISYFKFGFYGHDLNGVIFFTFEIRTHDIKYDLMNLANALCSRLENNNMWPILSYIKEAINRYG